MIESFLHLVIPLFQSFGYEVLFLSSFLESLLVVGTFVPGGVLAVFGGYMVRKHVLHFSLAVIVLTFGAFLGDVANYFIGKYYGYKFLKKNGKYFFLTEARLEYARDMIQKHRGKTLILGRFNSFTRALSPFAAGASHVELYSFLGYTLLSAFLWSFSHIFIGFVFGKWLEKVSRHLGLIFFIALIAVAGLVYLYRLINARHHIFKKFHIYTLATMTLSIFLFTSTLEGVLENDWLISFNHSIANFMFLIRSPFLTSLMVFITNLAGFPYAILVTLILIIYLVYKKRYHIARLTVFSVILGEALQYILKLIIGIPRPELGLVLTSLSSFPSGHTTAAVILCTFIFLGVLDSTKSKSGQYILFLASLIGALLIGFSRIYLNAHFSTDVIAGIALGLFTVSFSILLFRVVAFAKRWLY